MQDKAAKEPSSGLGIRTKTDRAAQIYRIILVVLQLVMGSELALLLYNAQWQNAFLVLAIMGLTLAPLLLGHQLQVNIPAEFQILAVLFVFAALFLGNIRSYYESVWWWDIALHTSSGLLLGQVGFLLVYLLNASERIHLYLRPNFVALFAFLFAVSVGTVWEIFEFTMDQIFGAVMQKPMLNDPSGLTDTMWDLIVDAVGAATISLLGWWYLRRGEQSFIENWIRKFITNNPGLFLSPRSERGALRRLARNLKSGETTRRER